MLQTAIFGFSIYELYFYFIIYSVLGWVMETILCSIHEKKFVDRGYLTGPYCPIYGTGMCLIIFALTPFRDWPAAVFAGGALIATLLEYVTSWVMEKLFSAKWWDYSDKKFNLHGRVCLSISLAWGGLSLLIMELLQPVTSGLVFLIPVRTGTVIIIIIAAILLLDSVHATITAAKLSKRLRSLDEIKASLRELYENSKWAENAEQLKKQLESKSIPQLLSEFNEYLKDNIEEQKGRSQKWLKKLKKKYRIISRPKFFERRMVNAFPTMRSKHNKNIKQEIGKKQKKSDGSK